MTGPTHIMAGLIIGQLTGDYVTAVACSYLVDADHLLPIIKQGFLFKPKKLRKGLIQPEGTVITDQRNYLHSIFALIILSLLVLLINIHVGVVFAIAYAVHLGFDMLDKSNYYPFYPFKSVNIKGIIDYASRQEFFFAGGLFIIRLILVFTHTRF